MAEEGTENTTPEWVNSIEDAGLKETLSQYDTQEAFLEKIGYKPPEVTEKDWREMIQDEEAKKFASDSTDINHLVKRALDLRKQVSSSIKIPGKDATPEQVKTYNKALGIPEKPEEYEFPKIPDDQLTDDIKSARAQWAKQFHQMGVPKETAKSVMNMLSEDIQKAQAAQVEADKAFARDQEEKLRSEWAGDEYDKNSTLANRALREFSERSSVPLEELTKMEMKDGRLLLDNASMVRLFAAIGREMSEGSLGPVLTDSERDTMGDELRNVRKQISEAQTEGDSKRANKLYQKEQSLIAKMEGDKPLVGAGRAA